MKTRNYALIAGYSLLLMVVTAGFAFGYAHSSLVLLDNPTLTLTNIQNASGLFGLEIIGWVIILVTDLLVAWSLYRFFQSVDKKVSLITGFIRLVYSAVLAFAISHLLVVWHLVSKVNPDADAVMEQIINFEMYWSLGLIIFGLHLVGLGYLSYKSKAIPKWIGFLLYVAGVSYTLIHLGKVIIPEAIEIIAEAEKMMSVPMAISELGLAIWLLRKGVSIDFTNNLN